ncbi:MAG: signal peptidase II [Thermoanaerobaculia bacterium]
MKRLPYLLISAAVIVLDLVTKALVLDHLALQEAVSVIPGLFQLVHVHNDGAAFGIGANSASPLIPLLLGIGALAVFFLVMFYSFRTALSDRVLQIGLHLILGGAIGNLLDRFRFGYVVDFLDFYVKLGTTPHHWPAFNIADSAICVGIALLFVDMWKSPRRSQDPA